MTRYLLASLFILFPSFIYAAGLQAEKVYEDFSPSVVVIVAATEEGGGSVGAGSIISEKGLIITNAHVVIDADTKKPYPKLGVFLKPAKLTGNVEKDLSMGYSVEVLKYSSELDLALLRAEDMPARKRLVELANPDNVKIGEEVVAIGHPEQGGFWSITYGRISGEMDDQMGIKGKDVYQTDTSINRGNSGGPLLDASGRMVAVNSNIARVGAGGLPITGVNFSIKSAVVKEWLLEEAGYDAAYGETLEAPPEEPVKAPAEKVEEKKVEEKKAEEVPAAGKEEKPKKEEKVQLKKEEEKFKTPEKPYDYNAALKAVEKELEDIMEEMRIKK